jgi:hypothetical protein
MSTRIYLLALFLILGAATWAAQGNPLLLDLNKRAFFYGREYFTLRSGRTQMIVQTDRADLGPAVTFMLFDSENSLQSASKEKAFNFEPGLGFDSSALEVVLGGFPFTALGHRTETHWANPDGIPAVEAVWWAGGIRVTERISALGGDGIFLRSILLEGANLVGDESVALRLSLAPGTSRRDGPVLLQNGKGFQSCLIALGNSPAKADETKGQLEIGPLIVAPGARVEVETALLVKIPARPEEETFARAKSLAASSAREEEEQSKRTWAASSQLTTKDRTVQELYDKARFGLPGMIADDGTMDAGIFEYGRQWVRDTSNTVLGAIQTGMFEAARNTLERILNRMITDEGATMIGSNFDQPDMEQFDQMGEFLGALKAYRDWTGDDSLLREHRAKILALIERPLQPRFRDETGMVHNRREFWERHFEDGYELAYQTYVVSGLRDAAEMASALGAEEKAEGWKREADGILQAMLSHPTRALVAEGHLIKRRNVTGEVADLLPHWQSFQPDVPLRTEKSHRLYPDTTMALPIALGLVKPHSPLALRTLAELEPLWNSRWSDGGYDRYHTSSQPDQPGPWPFATCFVLRAQHEAGLYERSRRSLEWLDTVQGGRAGAWFEEISSVRSQQMACGLIPWTSGEIALFVIRHWLGVRFEGSRVILKPNLYPDDPPVSADLRFRAGRLHLEIDGSGPVKIARVNGVRVKPNPDGSVTLPAGFSSGNVILQSKSRRLKESV